MHQQTKTKRHPVYDDKYSIYALFRFVYSQQAIYWGWSRDALSEAFLVLYKTGRTNANNGGIDFVMRPLGRFFQVTENVDVNKFFLDIDKVQRFPLTFVVKTSQSTEDVKSYIREQATKKYAIEAVVSKYMAMDLMPLFRDAPIA